MYGYKLTKEILFKTDLTESLKTLYRNQNFQPKNHKDKIFVLL